MTPEPMLRVEVSPEISTFRTSSGSYTLQKGDIPCPYSQRFDLRIGSRFPATTTVQTTLHLPLMDFPAGGEPTVIWSQVAVSG